MKILIVGDDFRLLATRAAVLAKTGASTVCCSAAEMLRDLEREDFELVVLCHSLSERDTHQVTTTTRRWWPQAQIVMVLSNTESENHPCEECDAVVPPDPNMLLRRVAALLLQKLKNNPTRKTVPVYGARASASKVERRIMA